MHKLVVVLLVLLMSCTPTRSKSTIPASAKIAIDVIEFISGPVWRESGYARLDDVRVPAKLIIAGDDTVCPIYSITVDPVRIGDLFQCPSKWLIRHD